MMFTKGKFVRYESNQEKLKHDNELHKERVKWRIMNLRLENHLKALKKHCFEKDEIVFNYGFKHGEASTVRWGHWLSLPLWTPKQAACLLFRFDPNKFDDNQCNGFFLEMLQKAEFKGNMSPYQWQQFGIEQNLPFSRAIRDIQKVVPKPVPDDGTQSKSKISNMKGIISTDTFSVSVYGGSKELHYETPSEPLHEKVRKDNLRRAIDAAISSLKRKPSFSELWQYFQDDKDVTGFIEDYKDTHITWRDTKGKFHDTKKVNLANRLSRIKF